jgi:hypothetical protein
MDMNDSIVWVVLAGINLWGAWCNYRGAKINTARAKANYAVACTNETNAIKVHEAQLQLIEAYDFLISHNKAQQAIDDARRVE